MNRRDILMASGALASSAWTADLVAKPSLKTNDVTPPPLPEGNFYFSSRNPAANRDQRDLEALAVQLQARPDVQAAIRRTADTWARATDHTVSEEVWAMFPQQIANYAFRSILVGVNSDPNFPKVLRVYSPAGHWMGADVPASKWGAENPDNCYRLIPVELGGRYVVKGQRQTVPTSYVSYTLVADTNTSMTVGSLERRDMEIAPDGSFEITLDDLPANGRKNHIQLTPDALYLFIRDTMADWRETPDALRVERLNPPARGPASQDELASRAIRTMLTGVYFDYYCIRLVLNVPPRTLSKVLMSGAVGGLVSQASTSGWFKLADDEAVIITTDAVDAIYHSIVLYDLWARSLDTRNHQSHLNNGTMVPDASGRITSVIALRDPGVSNWLDTTGQHEVQVGLRWQGLTPGKAVAPVIDTRVVKLAELLAALPQGVRMVTPAQRSKQIIERQRLFDRRFIDN